MNPRANQARAIQRAARHVRRELLPLLVAYAVFAACTLYMLKRMPSATYRDEWGFAEFRTAAALLAGVFPVTLPAANPEPYLKVADIHCSIATESLAAGIARLTGLPLTTVYAYGWWGAALAPAVAYALARQVATPVWSATAAVAASVFTVGFPFYLVDPKGLLLVAHGLFLLAGWALLKRPTFPRAALAALAVLLTAAVYMPFGVVEAGMLLLLLLISRASWTTAAGAVGALGFAVVAAPACYMPYANRVLMDLHFPRYPPPYVPHIHEHGISAQLVAAVAVVTIAGLAALARPLRLRSQQFLWASGASSLAFLATHFSIHRIFTFIALPLALCLAEAASQGRAPAIRIAPAEKPSRLPWPLVTLVGSAAPSVQDRRRRMPRWAVDFWRRGLAPGWGRRFLGRRAWRFFLLLFLALSLTSVVAYPDTPVARSGTFSREYLEGVHWVAENVELTYVSDVKFVGAVYAHTGNAHGYHILDNYGESGELNGMWFSESAEDTARVMQKHDARFLVLTADMETTFVVGDFFRKGIPGKMNQIRASPLFHLVFENDEVEVYELVEPATSGDAGSDDSP